MKKTLPSQLFLVWTGILIATYYVVQKPDLYFLSGLANTIWTFLVAMLMLFNAYGIGSRILRTIKFDKSEVIDHLLLSLGIGLGGLGLLGLAFSAVQLANTTLLTAFQFALGAFFTSMGDAKNLRCDLSSFSSYWRSSFSQYNLFSKLAVILPLLYSFLLTLTPPFEAFDALSYHLAQPARVLFDGGLRPVDIPAFWYPNLTENVYLWTLAMSSERAAQMTHLAWAILSILLLWYWAIKILSMEIGRKTLLLIVSLASLPLVSSWAYADMALVYYAIAALYSLSSYKRTGSNSWLFLTGIMAGFAMSVKYTSFTIPLACSLLLLLKRPFSKALKSAFQFSSIALLIALPWYLRNAIIMHNPVYPFLFNGLYWDSFRSAWYSNSGTGIGWNLFQILMIPINMILGIHELSPIDGRIGPLFLILLPFTLWILIKQSRQNYSDNWSLKTIGFFATLSFLAWTYGVINSTVLWQVRFFYPALIAFAIPTALGWDYLTQFDTPKLHVSFLINTVITFVITLTILENGLFVLQRNPLAVAFGVQTRTRYIERVNPSYASLIQIMDELPTNAMIYSLYEPRSYDLPRPTQPDLVLYNFAHDLHLYQTTDKIIRHWKSQGYSYILIYERGVALTFEGNLAKEDTMRQNALNKIRDKLFFVSQTSDGVYSIYKIP